MEANYIPTREWAIATMPGTDLDCAAFSSGMGDGAYVSHWGYAADGAPICLLTDFDVVGPAAPSAGSGRPWWRFW